jgi:predicted nucleotidyltransferase
MKIACTATNSRSWKPKATTFELAGARLLGVDAARIISPDTRRRIATILQSEQLVQQLVNQISVRAAVEHLERCELLVTKFRDAFLSAP